MFRSVKRPMFLLLFLLALFIAVNGAFSLSVGYAEDASQNGQIVSAKIKWVTTDNDGIPERLYIQKNYGSAGETISMQYQMDIVLTGTESHEPGTVRILAPKQIFHQRTGRADGSVQAAGYGNTTFPVPDEPTEGSSWHWENAEDGQFAIVNDVTLNAATDVMLQCSFTGLDPSKLVDMLPSDPLKVTVEVTTRSGSKDTMTTQELTAVVDTKAVLSTFKGGASLNGTVYNTPDNIYSELLTRLPGGAETANGYVYVCWKTQPYYEATQYFNLDVDLWAGEATGNGTAIPGIILGRTQDRSTDNFTTTQDSEEQAGQHYTRTVAMYDHDYRGRNDGNRAQSIWVAYPTASMQANADYTFTASAAWKMTEADPAQGSDAKEVTEKSANAAVNYTHSEWEYPAGSFGVYKYTDSHPSHTHPTIAKDVPDYSTSTYHKKNHTYATAVGALRNDRPVTLEYEVLTAGYGYAYTAGPTSGVTGLPEGWEYDPAHYLNWNYLMETTDDTVRVMEGDRVIAALEAEDYCFTGITVAVPEMFTYGYLQPSQSQYMLPGSTFGYKPDSSLAKPDVEVWVKYTDGRWELYETVTLRSGKKTLTFPDGVIGYRTRIATNQAACKLAVWPTLELRPSAHLKSTMETVLQTYTNVVVDNSVQMKTTYYYSATRPEEVQPSQSEWLQAAAAGSTQETSDSSSATLAVSGFKVSGHTGMVQDEPVNDTVNRRIKQNVYIYVDEESNLSSKAEYEAAVEASAVIPETSGTWYFLLPENMTPDLGSIGLRGGDRIIDKEVYDNFRGSGRVLLVVRATLTPNVTDPSETTGFTDRIFFSMDMYLPWEDYADLPGNKYVDFYAAFESGNPGTLGNLPKANSYYQTVGYPDQWPSIRSTWLNGAPSGIKQVMSDLDPDTDEARFVYLYGEVGLGGIDVMEQVEFRKDVRAGSTGGWSKGTEGETQVAVAEGGQYTYRMTVAAKHDSYIGGIIFYDAIEEHEPDYEQGLEERKYWSGDWFGKGQWQGTLVSVDMTELYAKGFGPWLYYSTETGLEFGKANSIDPTDTRGILQAFGEDWDEDYDLYTAGGKWHRVSPAAIVDGVWTVPDDTPVTAIAVDAQRGTNPATMQLLSPGDKVSVYLNMKAPSDGGDDNKWSAKGAYAHKTDNAASPEDIDWIAAADPANNLYAYNQAAVVYLRFSPPSSQASHGYVRDRSVLNFEYTRTGIVPETIKVRKTWKDSIYASGIGVVENHDGLRPDQVTVKLKGVPKLPTGIALTAQNDTTFEDTLVLTEADGWQGIFQNAPTLDRNGVPYAYTVTEEPVPGYTTLVYKDGDRTYEIINKHEEKEQVSIRVDKLWLNPDGTAAEAPDNAQPFIQLIRTSSDGRQTSTGHTFTKDEGWSYTFVVDRYEPGGFEYIYTMGGETNVPSGWFTQDDAVPLGVEVTADYDPNDIHTYRNFKKPDFGYLMVSAHAEENCKPKAGNNTALPPFPVTVEMKNGSEDLSGEYEYVIFDKAPVYYDSTKLPADAAEIVRGTIRSGGTITLEDNQCFQIIGLPGGTKCYVSETAPGGWEATPSRQPVEKTIRTGEKEKIAFRNSYSAKARITVTGTKKLRGREQQAGEFTFELIDNNPYNQYGYDNYTYNDVVGRATTGQSRGTVTENGTKVGLAQFTINGSYDGYSTFEINEYGAVKTLNYLVREVIPAGADTAADGTVTYNDVTYDTQTKPVTLTFVDKGDGTLRVTSSTAAGELVFTNVYGFERKITLTAHKELIGRTLQPGEFSFEVRRSGAAAGSAPIATGRNDAQGNITFAPDITLTERDTDAISPQTGTGEITFLISEVQGTDPTVNYMTAPAEAKVQLAWTEDSSLLVAMPGQTIRHPETACAACGGSGKLGGPCLVTVDLTTYGTGEVLSLADYFNDTYMNICARCGGTGWDPDAPGVPCSVCNGLSFDFIACTHEHASGDACPDCLYGTGFTRKAVHVPGGQVLVSLPYVGRSLTELCEDLQVLDPANFPASASGGALLVYTCTEEHWTAAAQDPSSFDKYMDGMGFVYIVDGGDNNTCPVCGGTGTVLGQPYIDGDALPVQLVNYLKTEVSFTAEKTLEGQPASEPFTFILLETDEERRTETEIARTQNGTDGKITFNPVALNPATPKTYYYIVREVADAENSTIAYDTGEDIYKVTVSLDNDGVSVVDKKLMSGDGVFRNTYKGGTLEIEVKTGGHIPRWPWWQPPKFPVNVVLKDCEGRPLAGYPLPTSTQKVKVSAKAGNGMLTVSDVMTRAESTAGNVTDSEGRGTIMIEGGSVATITGLPDGVTYEASQPADSMPKGYSQGSAEGTTGTIRAGQVSKATFENNYQGEEGEEPAPTSEQPKPSAEPTPSDKPTDEPTVKPTATPTAKPTDAPTAKPTEETTANPTETPKVTPTAAPAPTDTPKPQPVPKTGDTDNPMLWVGLILIGLIGIGGLAYGKYRKKK